MFERVKELCEERNISIRELERQLGYSRNTLYSLKNQTPGIDKVVKIADYFNVSTDYLLERTNIKEISKSRKDYDVKEKLEQLLEALETENNLQYNVERVSEKETRKYVGDSLPNGDSVANRDISEEEIVKDIGVKLKQILLELETNDNLQYNGKPITAQEKSNIEVALKVVLEIKKSSGN